MAESYLRRQLLLFGKHFDVSNEDDDDETSDGRCSDIDSLLPRDREGFVHRTYTVRPYLCKSEYDPRAVYSLPLMPASSPVLQEYTNKLPILTANVTRLQYTLKAFRSVYGSSERDYISEALEFLVKHDLSWIEHDPASSTTPANLKFSRFLHLLRSTGYEDYIFSLARKLRMNVDYVRRKRSPVQPKPTDHEFLNRYIHVGCGPRDLLIPDRANPYLLERTSTRDRHTQLSVKSPYVYRDFLSNPTTNSNGFITAIREGDRWYVDVTVTPVIIEKALGSYYRDCGSIVTTDQLRLH